MAAATYSNSHRGTSQELCDTIAELEEQLQNLDFDLRATEAQNLLLSQKLDQVSNENQHLREMVEQHQLQLREKDEEILSLNKKLKESAGQSSKLAELETENERLSRKVADLMSVLTTRASQWKSEETALNIQVESLQSTVSQLQRELSLAKAQSEHTSKKTSLFSIHTNSSKVRELQLELEGEKAEADRLREQNSKLRAELREMKSEMRQMKLQMQLQNNEDEVSSNRRRSRGLDDDDHNSTSTLTRSSSRNSSSSFLASSVLGHLDSPSSARRSVTFDVSSPVRRERIGSVSSTSTILGSTDSSSSASSDRLSSMLSREFSDLTSKALGDDDIPASPSTRTRELGAATYEQKRSNRKSWRF